MGWTQGRHNNLPPNPQEDQPVRKMFDGIDLLSYPGDVPTQYGQNIARVLWSEEELFPCIMSPGKDFEYMHAPRKPMTQATKKTDRWLH